MLRKKERVRDDRVTKWKNLKVPWSTASCVIWASKDHSTLGPTSGMMLSLQRNGWIE